MLRRILLLTALVALATNLACGGSASTTSSSGGSTTPPPPTTGTWTLTWSDEFDGANGSLPDSSKWVMETGGSGWGNNELESYTNRAENVHQQDGNLVITAMKEDYTGTDGVLRNYTSARIKTAGKFSQAYGKFEAKMKIPAGQGIWPAFWMLGSNIDSVSWPTCGEIDIMENIGKEPGTTYGTIHGPSTTDANHHFASGTSYTLPNGQRLSDDFHVYAVEWEQNTVRFYIDGTLYGTQTNANMPSGGTWVFDHPFFVLLNVAVGGNWPGNPDSTTVFPQTMLVDYVRVYKRQ
jgi:beta-glucanase (GH16 family)